jgi:DNA-binding HxlR family transcriptional regulator
MTAKRTYGDPCGIARALDHVGERWALLVVRELLLGPKRFTDLRHGLPNVSPDVLSQRLRELEQAGIVRRGKLPPPAGARIYALTARGRELEPVVLALGRWGSRASFPPGAGALGVDAAVLALETLFDAEAAAGVEATYGLRLDDQPFDVRVNDGELSVTRGEAQRPDAIIDTDPGTLAAVLWHGSGLSGAVASGALRVAGSGRAVETFLNLFPAPEIDG